MSGQMGSIGASRVANEQLNVNVPRSYREWVPGGMPPKSGKLLDVPGRFSGGVVLAACAGGLVCMWLNRRLYGTTVDSMTPEFQDAVRRIGPVAERTDAPPVFLNPISNRIPGYYRGPDDIQGLEVPTGAQPRPELLRVLPGFSISLWRSGLTGARSLASVNVSGSTIVYVGSREEGNGRVFYVVDQNSDGIPDFSGSLLSGIAVPNGVAVWRNDLYVSGFEGGRGMVWKINNAHSYALQNKAYDGSRVVVTDQLPGDGWHGRRYLRFDPNGILILGIGVPCNTCPLQTRSNGIEYGTIYALNVTSGLLVKLATDCELNRLPYGYNYYRSTMAQPRTSTFNLAVRFNKTVSNFGFPFCHAQGSGNPYRRDVGPGVAVADPDLNNGNSAVNCAASSSHIRPVQAVGPHTAPLGMRFYRYNARAPRSFPASFNRVAFIVQRGSWNRSLRIGYRVMLLRLGRGSGGGLRPELFEQFAWGWLQNENQLSNYAWGRPVDVEQLPDGSLVVSDDDNGCLYRITYIGPPRASAAATEEEAGAAAGN
eukprot:gene1767-2106_t